MTGIVKAIYGAPERPLKIGNVEISCYVLEDERRVLVRKGMIHALGISKGGGKGEGDRLTRFTHQDRLKSFIPNEVLGGIANPIRFRTTSGSLAYGYEAEALAKICFAVLDAAKNNVMLKQQEHIVRQCEILVRGFAIVGINALVDEATGYQAVRAKEALAKILEKYIAKEFRAWTKTFPDEFYKEMFRLKSWPNDPTSIQRPSIIGRYTNDVVYERLAPGVLKELQKINPRTESGYRKHKHHQWLTGDIGHPKLKEHLLQVIALMRAASTWDRFHRLLERALPRLNDTIPLPLDLDEEL